VPQARAMAEKYGRAPEQLRAGIFCWSAVAEDAAWARRASIESVSTTYRQDFTDLADRYLVSGSREQVVDRISQYAEAGATEMIFAPACPPADRPGVVRFFAEWVMPLLQSLVPACSGAAETAVVRGGDR
jgi:alkanesulfonate monooxygenase SsuD/methylene tetrahydromethanopterin reductase-like flavin-dependent oxidoreductase (luciferase family)